MKKKFFGVVCVIALTLGLFLVSCQQKEETAKDGAATEATGGYGSEQPAESGGYGAEKPAETGGYGQ